MENRRLYVEVGHSSLIKKGEELCGDKVNVVTGEDSTIVILADGLGSGVKANILATLTSKIAGEMLKHGAMIEEVVQTIAETLPACKVRGVAYSTFTILQAFHDGTVYLVEYDNPPTFHFRNGKLFPVEHTERIINGRRIKEARFLADTRDVFLFVSDGVIHAGVGGILNLGWQWDNVAESLGKLMKSNPSAEEAAHSLTETCEHLYCMEPGDDTTAVCVKFRHPSPVSLLIGPPDDSELDDRVVQRWFESPGKKIICGGTSANIVSRVLDRPLQVELPVRLDPDIPPTARMEGIDLVTEGVLTLRMALFKLKEYAAEGSIPREITGSDGVSRLLRLLKEATEIHFHVGTAINPAHQNPNFPADLNIKLRIIDEIVVALRKLGYPTDRVLY
ncbi:SpoIIE family protein phosphatase [Gorillibacterium sp. CAU 1737]|uniref:SpoIIE family protein phosphatase n=1 Tax=Gorillibacterium sp. CAU 1737 TaxID=3140362 RepID=UPI00326188AC